MKERRVLVVDDHSYIRKLISNILEQQGYIIIEACDGQEAARIFLKEQDQKFDLITMDYQMPRLNGAEAIQKIRHKNKKVPIICISASIPVMRPQVQDYINIYYLNKPFYPDQLREIIQQIHVK